MNYPRKSYTIAMISLLEKREGEVVSTDELLEVSWRLVPPSKALRAWKRNSKREWSTGTSIHKRKYVEDAIYYGARSLCRGALRSFTKRKNLPRVIQVEGGWKLITSENGSESNN